MKLSELKSILTTHLTLFPRFVLPDGDQVPAYYHLTEVGHVSKDFIDCGGTMRTTETCSLQLWSNDSDADHRLDAGKFVKILKLGDRVLPNRDLDVEVEYDEYAISQFPITSYEATGEHIDFTLATKHTDCLAKEKCGVGDDSCGCATEERAADSACC
jgi:hypothetical protein